MTTDLAILVSVGVHPMSGRPRCADLDARAVELGLRLAERQAGLALHVVHAGSLPESVASDYLGMGVARITVLELPEDSDPLPPLVDHLARLKPTITLAGLRSEVGEGAGFLPYALADALGFTMAPAIVDVVLDGSGVRLVQALRGGVRRSLSASVPIIATVDRAAPEPRQRAYGKARRGRIETLSVDAPKDTWRSAWQGRPARKRGRTLDISSGASLAERRAFIADTQRGAGQHLVDPTPEEAARAIRDFLRKRGLLNTTRSA